MSHAVRSRPIHWALLALVASAIAALVAQAPPARAERPVAEAPDELTPEQDNADARSKAACQDVRSAAGSLLIRRLIDGPRRADGQLAFRSGVCIYLPPGYEDGTKRYPVLYLLHGGSGWQEDWFTQGKAADVMDEAYAADPANAMIVVTPDGTSGGTWQDQPSGQILNETYVFDHVIPYVDRYLRTIPDLRGRALSGLSQGGAGTLRLAALRPDQFSVVTAMSSALPLNMAVNRTNIREVANDPTEIADNLELVDLAIIYGRHCGDAAEPGNCAQYGFQWAFEHACCSNEAYVAKLEAVRDRPFRWDPVVGGHDWMYWTRWLRAPHGPYIRERLMDPVPAGEPLPPLAAPETFDYRGIKPAFGMYDYTFTNDPARAREFLTLTDVGAGGLTVTGSGTLGVTTAARYLPGATYTVSGAGGDSVSVLADAEGRLSFPVDLGPAHTADQGTADQVRDEAAAGGGYWVTRTVTITPEAAA